MNLLLPKMRCDVGCGACCGPAVCNAAEMREIAAHRIKPLRQGVTCPFCRQGACAIYPVRPFICRIFGHSPWLVCRKGYNVNLPRHKLRRLQRRYARTGVPDRWLHSFVYPDPPMLPAFQAADEQQQP